MVTSRRPSPPRRVRFSVLVGLAALLLALAPSVSVSASARADVRQPDAVVARRLINGLLDVADLVDHQGAHLFAGRLRMIAAVVECRRFGCKPAAGDTSIAMDPARAGGFFSMPWPSDTRRKADGSLDLTGFPGRDANPVAETVLARGESTTFGFGTNSAVFLQTTSPIDPASLPSADASTGKRSAAMLIDLDHRDAPPIPLLADFKAPGVPLRPANLLALLPYPGHPLRGNTRYAAMVFDGLLDTAGHRLSPSPLLARLDGPAPAGTNPDMWSRLRAERDAALRAVRRQSLWHPSEAVAFTVFTTQDTSSTMASVAAAVRAQPTPALTDVIHDSDPPVCPLGQSGHFSAHIDLPRWQAGTPPYQFVGGDIVVGADGRAVRQGTDGALVDVVVPCDPPPPSGWPILLFMDGTGGSANAQFISQIGAASQIPEKHLPFAVLSIAPLFSGDRFVPSPLPGDLAFFNYLNPLAGRTNQLQQAADVLTLKRVAEAMAPGGHPFDRTKTVVVGHSQGAISIPMTLAADPTIKGAFISAGGGGLYHSVVHRNDVQTLIRSLLPVQPGEVDIFHPLAHVLQTFLEIGDGANYAPFVRSDVLIYGGLLDGCTAIESNVHLAEALGVPIALPVTRQPLFTSSALEPPVVAVPVSRNLPGGRTGVLVELNAGHFGATEVPRIGRSFVDSIAAGGPTTVDPGDGRGSGQTSAGQCVRADAPPRPL